MKNTKAKADLLAPHQGPVMCGSCDFANQVQGEWRGDTFYPASDKCRKCDGAKRARKD